MVSSRKTISSILGVSSNGERLYWSPTQLAGWLWAIVTAVTNLINSFYLCSFSSFLLHLLVTYYIRPDPSFHLNRTLFRFLKKCCTLYTYVTLKIIVGWSMLATCLESPQTFIRTHTNILVLFSHHRLRDSLPFKRREIALFSGL